MGIDDVTMGDAQLVQAGGPEFEFRTVCASETDVVQPWASLIETVSRIRCAVRVETEGEFQRSSQHGSVTSVVHRERLGLVSASSGSCVGGC